MVRLIEVDVVFVFVRAELIYCFSVDDVVLAYVYV